MIVKPNSLFNSFNNLRIDSVVSGSKAEVPSSDNNTSGSKTNALAIATLCA